MEVGAPLSSLFQLAAARLLAVENTLNPKPENTEQSVQKLICVPKCVGNQLQQHSSGGRSVHNMKLLEQNSSSFIQNVDMCII